MTILLPKKMKMNKALNNLTNEKHENINMNDKICLMPNTPSFY